VMYGLGAWPFRVVWATLPLTAGPLFAAALDSTRTGFRTAVSLGLWGCWAALLIIAFVPRSLSLTALRIGAVASAPAGIWAALDPGDAGNLARIGGLVACLLASFAVLAPDLGDQFADGSSYGDERRFLLRPAAALLLGPILTAWMAVVVGATAGPLWLADQHWIIGALATIVGWPLAGFAARALHTLSRRWLVFVPAGVVLHDGLALREPVLFARNEVQHLQPAPADSTAFDLTLGAYGLALELRLRTPREIGKARDPEGGVVAVEALLTTPSLPGRVTNHALDRLT
ncbi:MAG: hypothetical protein HKN26_16285, partial [Acidimicrobiales bacterium]|nr:hypothetical protein [Acidimicrobiales bacterium]